MYKGPLILLFATIVGLCPAQTRANGANRPTISAVTVYVADGQLLGDLTASNVFSERVAGTVQSGLPAVIELVFKLIEGRNITVNEGLVAYELRYDVWEDIYTITGTDSTLVYATFEDMGRAIENLDGLWIGMLEWTRPDRDYIVELGLAIYPLRSKDKRDIEGWVSENVRSGEQGRRQQVLNLNELIEHFFSRNRDDATRSKLFRTGKFRTGTLPVRNGE